MILSGLIYHQKFRMGDIITVAATSVGISLFFLDFRDRCAAVGINCPIAAGVIPVFKSDQIKAITAKSGCSIPARLVLMMDKYSSNPDDLKKAGIEYAGNQIRGLIENGVDGIHLYTMNRPASTGQVLECAGLI